MEVILMARTESQADKTQRYNFLFPEIGAITKQRVDELIQSQTQCLQEIQEANRHWFERMQSEATLASEFANKLAVARSLPETASVCQEWTSRRMELAAEDAKSLSGYSQKFAEIGARLLSNGWLPNGSAGST
jgi:phasin protein